MKNTSGRLLMGLCVVLVGGNMWDTASLILWQPGSATRALASMTRYPDWVAMAYLWSLALMAPFGVAQVIPHCRYERDLAKAAMLGLFVAGFLWMSQVFVGRYTDLAVIRLTYARNGAEAMVLMLLMGTLLNAQLRRRHHITDEQAAQYRSSNRVPTGRVPLDGGYE